MDMVTAPSPDRLHSRAAGRRREIRVPVRLLGTLTPPSGLPASVLVTDLSRGGARCSSAGAIAEGKEVALKLDGLEARGIICWASDGQFGLRFVEPLRASDVLIQSGRSQSGASPIRPMHLAITGWSQRHGS